MGIKCPPIYGENVEPYVKEGKIALETALVEYNKGNKEKAISAVEYAKKCVDDLLKVLNP